MDLVLAVILVGNLTTTSYRSVPDQTDDSPYHTSTGERVCSHGAAISQDLLCKACLRLHKRCEHPENVGVHYGDQVYIDGIGWKTINDSMGRFKHYSVPTKDGKKRLKYRQDTWIDIWLPTLKDEQDFHKHNGFNKHKVWIVKGSYEKER